MLRRVIAVGLVLAVAGTALAFQVPGTIKKIDTDRGVVVVFANGQDRTLKVDKDVKVLDKEGKDLADGLKSKELKEGTQVTLTVEREGGGPVLKAIQLGARAPGAGAGAARGAATMLPMGGKDSVGLKPLSEMTAEDRYKGEDGGLYGGGKNEPPEAQRKAAEKATAHIVPRDADGKPSPDGKIVLVSISMSNATMEFSKFKEIADEDPEKSPKLTIVDCAQGGQAMAQWVDPKGRAWTEADRRLAAAKISPQQVQIAWIKLANVRPKGELTEHGKKLQKDTEIVLQNAKARFPNLQIAYLGSRIYAGYASTELNPEPYAYEGAFVCRWLIQDQIKGDPNLNDDPSRGDVKAPVLLWGPYLWADGMTPRKDDGLVWKREDLVGTDGTHPSMKGREKVAELLLKFLKTDPYAKPWFVKK